MSNNTNYNREMKKESMRQRVVPEQTEASRKEMEEIQNSIRKYYKKRAVQVLAVLSVVLVLFLVGCVFYSLKEYSTLEVAWEEEYASANAQYAEIGSQLIRCTSDGIACLDNAADSVWEYAYTMSDPVIVINGDYGAVGDREGTTAVIFNSDGVIGSITTSMPILDLTVSSYGVAALMMEDPDTGASYIYFYDNSGEELDISVKNVLTETSGYPLDLTLSPTGTGLILSLIYLDEGSMETRMTFLNFDVGKSSTDRVVGVYSYGNEIFPQVEYLSDEMAVAFGDNGLVFYSLENEASPQEETTIALDTDIQSVFIGEDRIGVIVTGESSLYELQVYSTYGRLLFTHEVDFSYENAEFSGNFVVLYGNGQCLILNRIGVVKYEGSIEDSVQKIYFLNRRSFLQFGTESIKEMKMK